MRMDDGIVVTMDSSYDNKDHAILHRRLVHQCGMEAHGSQLQIIADADADINADSDADVLRKQQQVVVMKSLVWTACCMMTTQDGEETMVSAKHHHFVTVLPLEHQGNEP
jgi:hypothetical protein